MLNWGPFMLKPRTGFRHRHFQTSTGSAGLPFFSPPRAEISHLLSLARLGLGSQGLYIFPL